MFIPVLFMGGIVGRLFHEFAVTIVAAILVSGVVSLTLTPMLVQPDAASRRAAASRSRLPRAACSSASKRFYERTLHWRWPRPRMVLLTVFALLLATTAVLFAVVPKGFISGDDTGISQSARPRPRPTSRSTAMAEKQQASDARSWPRNPNVADVVGIVGGGAGGRAASTTAAS